MTTISYAANQEDVLLDRAFARGKPGFYIDVGAGEPVAGSITKHFYDLGWRGINVEPAGRPFEMLQSERRRDVNLNVALSDEEGELAFFEFPASHASTLSKEQAQRHHDAGLPSNERIVAAWTLAKVCERHVDGPIDFLAVRVEGHERHVLKGADWSRWRPRVVVVQATEPGTTVPAYDAWEGILVGAGYRPAAFDGLNRYYVAEEASHLAAALAAPVNAADGFVAYEQHRQIEQLTWRSDLLERHLAAAQALNATLRTECEGSTEELRLLRAQYERLERSLTTARERGEAIRAEVAGMLAQAGAIQEIPEGVSPAALGVARRLTSLSARYPGAADVVKMTLRLGLRTKRTLQNGRK